MIYVIADIHGCYEKFCELLEKIHFSDNDRLYVLGDMVDRGPRPVKLLQDLMLRPNVYPVLGNHDYMALRVLRKLNVEITPQNAETYLTADDLIDYMHWTRDGGDVTAKQFSKLSPDEKQDILDYLLECSLFEEIQIGEKLFVLVHAGIHNFDETKDLNDYDLPDFLFYRANYKRRYFSDKNVFLVTGHTPTISIREDRQPLVYEAHGHIAIDCGCVFGGRLAAYCLDTQEAFYV